MRRYSPRLHVNLYACTVANVQLEEYYDNYKKASGDVEEQQKIANQFIWEVNTPLSSHTPPYPPLHTSLCFVPCSALNSRDG